MAALERAVNYSKERVQFGTTLSEKQGYTHKLLVPHAVQLEAARAHIEETGRRLDTDEKDLQVEGSIAKYFATEAGDAMANDAIQAFGGYGYTREYEVEKIKRDIKILTIYEGPSEIQQNIISTFRLRNTVRSKGGYYHEMADRLEKLPEECGGAILAKALRAINTIIFGARKNKLTKSQHVMFQLADMITWCEVANALCHKAAVYDGNQESSVDYVKACARLFARESLDKVHSNGIKIAQGCGRTIEEAVEALNSLNVGEVMAGRLQDMDLVSAELVA
jgi:alkylation response protein AidB-like acyl-CoA dehydrogenase